MQTFYSDTPEGDTDAQDAQDLLVDLLANWQASGRYPAALLNAMDELLTEIVEQVAEPIH